MRSMVVATRTEAEGLIMPCIYCGHEAKSVVEHRSGTGVTRHRVCRNCEPRKSATSQSLVPVWQVHKVGISGRFLRALADNNVPEHLARAFWASMRKRHNKQIEETGKYTFEKNGKISAPWQLAEALK